MTVPKIAFIIQRYGESITGGAEAHCRMVAEYMTRHWQVEVLTTCAEDYITWANALPAGTETLNGVTVRRFATSMPRNKRLFDACYDLLAPLTTLDQPRRRGVNKLLRVARGTLRRLGLLGLLERLWMRLQGPYAPSLWSHIHQHGSDYDAVVAFSYVYATSFHGLGAARCPTLLVPTAHDDPPLRFSIFAKLFQSVDSILANTREERELLLQRIPHLDSDLIPVVGCGINLPERLPTAEAIAAFKARHQLTEPYAIYVGRIEPFKGCQDLMGCFVDGAYGQRDQTVNLVLVGKAEMDVPSRDATDGRIIPLGFLSEEDKLLAIAGSELLVMPSPYESLSLVLLEAWYLGKPVLVNGACEVLKGQCQRSGGGLWFDSWQEFHDQLDAVRAGAYDPQALRGFVEDNYGWPAIAERYLDAFQDAQRFHQSR